MFSYNINPNPYTEFLKYNYLLFYIYLIKFFIKGQENFKKSLINKIYKYYLTEGKYLYITLIGFANIKNNKEKNKN
jgi:hypothetical protein